MTEKAKKEQRAYSYEEYRRKFYPYSAQENKEQSNSPYELGVKMAKESLERVRDTK